MVTAIVAITINFFLPRLLPGNPALAVLGKAQLAESPQAVAALEVQYGVQTRTGEWGQYVQYWGHLLHGNLGTSLNAYPASVGSLIRAALPWTLGLVGTATVIGFVLGTLIGVAAAWRRGSWLDNLLPAMTFFQGAGPRGAARADHRAGVRRRVDPRDEYSTRNYTGWPTAANPYIDPVPNAPYMEYTLLHLTPAS